MYTSKLSHRTQRKKYLFLFFPFCHPFSVEAPYILHASPSQTVSDFLSHRHNKVCHFISDIMDYFLASKDQQPQAASPPCSLHAQDASDATYDEDMDASHTQCPSIQIGDAGAETRDVNTRWRGLASTHSTMDHTLQWMRLLHT